MAVRHHCRSLIRSCWFLIRQAGMALISSGFIQELMTAITDWYVDVTLEDSRQGDGGESVSRAVAGSPGAQYD